MPPNSAADTTQEEVTVDYSPLYLPVEDVAILGTINQALNDAVQKRNEEKIDSRTKTNNDFWVGQQVNESAIDKRYQMAHVDNVIYPDLENRLSLAAGRTPDIILLPPDRADDNMEAARSLQSVLREKIDSNTIKRLIKDGLRNLHTDFIGIIKPRWDAHTKDFTFELLLSENVFFAKGSKVPHDGYTIDGSSMVFQWVEEPVKVVLAKFPAKAQQLMQALAASNRDKTTLPSHIRYLEVHFTWYDNQGKPMEGVAWKYQQIILDKMRQPYFDYQTGNNFFDRPHKPYILLSYQNRGRSVYETTTAVEQAVPINRIVNKRLRQITEIADRAVPKLAFRGGAISTEMARNISTSPKEAIVLTSEVDDIRKEMQIVPSQPPNPILYNDLLSNRGRIDTLMATHGTTRGEVVGTGAGQSGISKQISREGDMVTSDDMVDIVVERVVYEMVCWALHFMRLYYDDQREPVRLAQKDEGMDIVQLDRQKIDTKVDVVVKASTTDKQTMRANAIQMLEAKTIDPYTLFEDLDVPNPKERLKRLLAFQQGQGTPQQPADFTAYLNLIGVSLDEHSDVADQQRAQADIQALKAGQQVDLGDKPPTDAYVAEFIKYVNSPEFEQLPPETQQMFQQHVQQLKAQLAQLEAQGGQNPTLTSQPGQPQPGQPPAPPGGGGAPLPPGGVPPGGVAMPDMQALAAAMSSHNSISRLAGV